MHFPYEPVLPPDSLILITGVNGFLGSHIANQFLLGGYRVKGTVRNLKKNTSLQELFDERYGQGRFELVEVEDLSAPGSFDPHLRGVSGVAHTASDVSLCDDPNVVVTGAIKAGLNIINAAARVSTVKRFVYLSSTVAAITVRLNERITVGIDQFNEFAKRVAWEPPPYDGRGPHVYGASKAETEEALWKFVRDENPGFTFNTVLPDVVFGPSLDPQRQGFPSTSGWIVEFFKGNEPFMKQIVDLLPPQYFVDVEDVGRLHVLAMTHPKVANERLFGAAEIFDFNMILAMFRKLNPEMKFHDDFQSPGEYLFTFEGRDRADDLLKLVFGRGFLPLEESVAATVRQIAG